MSDALYRSVGGREVQPPTRAFSTFISTGGSYWDFGWVPFGERSDHENQVHDSIIAGMPTFAITGSSRENETKANLTELWGHSDVVKTLGYAYPGTHQLTGSCFPAGSPVRMADGSEKVIEDVIVGDQVFAHNGKKRRVVRVFRRQYAGTLHTFHVKGWRFPITMTADHDCLVVRGRESCQWRWEFGGYTKKKAKDVEVGERFLLPSLVGNEGTTKTYDLASIDDIEAVDVDRVRSRWREFTWERKRYIDLDDRLAWVLGLFLAEGTLKHNKVFFHLNPTTKAITATTLEANLRAIFGDDLPISRVFPKVSVLQIIVHDGIVARLIRRLISGNTYTKRLPGDVLNAKLTARLAALRGWMDGDGYFQTGGKKRGVSLRGVTACEGLARDMGQLALTCGLRPSVLRRKKAGHQRVASLDLYLNGTDALSVYPDRIAGLAVTPRSKLMEKTPLGYATAIERIETEQVHGYSVYCCEVEEEHSLIVNGLAQHQCVGAGGGNVAASLAFVEVIRLGDPEKVILPFYPFTYGRSRSRSGMGGRGEGSTGTGWAEAAKQDGILDNLSHPELPKPKNSDALVWGSSVEMDWSAGERSPCKDWLDKGRVHLIKTVSRCRNAGDVRAALLNYYPVTEASMYGFNAKVEDGVLLGRRGPRWAHQMSFHAFQEHPKLGPIYWLMNQWGLCYDRETEILTESGWSKFSDLSRDVKVATLNPNTHCLEYQSPTDYHEIPYSGDLINFRSQGVDLMVTPNHRMYLHPMKFKCPDSPSEWRVVEAQDCPMHFRTKKDALWVGEEVETYRVGEIEVLMDDWLEFLGYYLSEGSCGNGKARNVRRKKSSASASFMAERQINCRDEWETKRICYTIYISQKKVEGVLLIESLLSRLPWNFIRTKDGWVVNSKALWKHLRALGKSHERRIPKYVRSLCRRQQRILFDAMMVGDGTYSCGNATYYTSSPGMADDVQELLLKIGLAGDVASIDRVGRDNGSGITRHVEYRVNIKRTRLTPRPTEGHRPLAVPYLGTVYCVTVPNGLVYVRRNGVAQWSGNSAHGRCPTGMPGGGVWVLEKDVEYMCGDEVYAFSQFDGYPAPDFEIPWILS